MKSHTELDETIPETHVIKSNRDGRTCYILINELSSFERVVTLSEASSGSDELRLRYF